MIVTRNVTDKIEIFFFSELCDPYWRGILQRRPSLLHHTTPGNHIV
jgi:hypothetical protein